MQDIKQGCHKGEMSGQVTFNAMKDVFEMTYACQRREQDFNQHPFTPGLMRTQQEIAIGIACFGKAQVAQGHGQSVKLLCQGAKVLVVNVGGVPVPSHHLPLSIDQPAQLDPNYPASIGLAFLAQRLRVAAFAHGMTQLYSVAVHDRKEARTRHKSLTPHLVARQLSQQAGSVRQPSKQHPIVASQPAVETAKIPTAQTEQQPDGNQFTWVQLGLMVFWYLAHMVIYLTKQLNDKLFGGHRFWLSLEFQHFKIAFCDDLFQLAPVIS